MNVRVARGGNCRQRAVIDLQGCDLSIAPLRILGTPCAYLECRPDLPRRRSFARPLPGPGRHHCRRQRDFVADNPGFGALKTLPPEHWQKVVASLEARLRMKGIAPPPRSAGAAPPFAAIVKRYATAAGLDASSFGAHSLRAATSPRPRSVAPTWPASWTRAGTAIRGPWWATFGGLERSPPSWRPVRRKGAHEIKTLEP
ncbi:hypothetical protein Mnod_8735 (plasmid) [Methylobacterium nodulans ORS 2060]|uniref:Uncharacterized protein n=1 Tax=Methylobacterium nodulans (strain LMG 21967 / CNCM I-2342 / ORS 2060) TaxID=460265 RepID=B8IWK1_METNO|nr:hypothetical protein Mnod_8735 [Methylobacterium nodulans ORS 2060]